MFKRVFALINFDINEQNYFMEPQMFTDEHEIKQPDFIN
jgi:hypothetical protein